MPPRAKKTTASSAGAITSSPEKKTAPLGRIGNTGLRQFAGVLFEEFLPQLMGRRAVQAYKEMSANDPIVGASFYAIDMGLRRVKWWTEPADDSPEALANKEFLDECKDDMSQTWPNFISEINTNLIYGWSWFEIMYKRREDGEDKFGNSASKFNDGKIGWRNFDPRSQDSLDRWEIDEDGDTIGMWQQIPNDYEIKLIPIRKSLLFRTISSKNSPEGKALTLGTSIPTIDGWKTMGDLRKGDRVFDEAGKVRHVVDTKTWKNRPVYRVHFSDGAFIDADANHQWVVQNQYERNHKSKGSIRTTQQISKKIKTGSGYSNYSIPWSDPVEYAKQNLLLNPWYLGLWLGDGTSRTADISCHVDDVEETVQLIEEAGYVTKVEVNGQSENGRLIRVYGDARLCLRALDLKLNKHIPQEYLHGSVDQRIALLSGLMDSDGTVDNDGRCEFVNVNMKLVEGVAELVRSLGVSAKISLRKRAGNSRQQDAYCVKFTPDTFVPFRLSRKISRCGTIRARTNHYIVAVEKLENQDTKCIEVDSPSHMFLAGESFVATHNSVLRNAYRPWYFKKRVEEIEGIGIERDLAGLPFAEVPAAMMGERATAADKSMVQSIFELVKNVRRDQLEGVVWPQEYDANGNKMYEFKLMSSGGTRQFSTDQTITRYEQRIAMTVLADFILLGNDSSGSFAIATSKTGLFQSSLSARLDEIRDVLNNYAIPRLFKLNGITDKFPRFVHDEVQKPSLTDLATLVAALAGAGAQLFPDTDLENHIRQEAQLPVRERSSDAVGHEDELRSQQLATQLLTQKAQQKMAQNPQAQPGGGAPRPFGKQPDTKPGAPTKITGPVKSKLPPQQRRNTAAVSAAGNVLKRRKVRVVRKAAKS